MADETAAAAAAAAAAALTTSPAAPPTSLLSIPTDVLALVVSHVARADVRCVAWFGAACRAWHAVVKDPGLIELCEAEMRLPRAAGSRALSVQMLALHEAVRDNIGDNSWLVFRPGHAELKPGEAPRLARAATLLRRFEGVQLEIEGHAAAAAPDDKADSLARSRTMLVLRAMLERGTPRERLQARVWGRRLSADWPDEPATARAEIYFACGGERFPARPTAYDEFAPTVPPLSPRHWPPVGERSGGAAGGVRPPPDTSRRGLLQMVRQVRAEKATASTSDGDGPSGSAAGAGAGSEEDQAAREQRERRARAAERRLCMAAMGRSSAPGASP